MPKSAHKWPSLCMCILTAFVEEATIVLILFHCPFLFAKGQVHICISVFLSSLLIPLIFFCILSLAHTAVLAVVLLSRS